MESHRLNGSPGVRVQGSYMQEESLRGSQDNLFGVRVQVQGFKGQPYVVLNSSVQESHRDISVITHQAGYNPGMVRRSADERHYPAETQRPAASSVFHYKRHPEILRPYDPESNNLNVVIPSQLPSVARPGPPPENLLNANTTRPRIPLPAEGPGEDHVDVIHSKAPPSGGHIPARSPNLVDTDSILSVGKLISQFNSSQRRGRGGPRNRLDSEQCRRSRSVDSGRTSDSSSSSSSSSRPSSLKAIKGEIYPPGSARARLLGGKAPLTNKGEEQKPITLLKGHHEKETTPPHAANRLHKTSSVSSSFPDHSNEPDERDAQVMRLVWITVFHLKMPFICCIFSDQVTPDLLKGQQELTVDPTEDTTKLILFTYLKDGTTDDDSTTQRKVNLLLERINGIKWRTAENVEEEEKVCWDELFSSVVHLQEKQAALEKEVSGLKQKLETEMKKTLAKACEKARTEKKKLQEELTKSQTELCKLRDRLAEIEAELQSTKHELSKMKAERERSRTEMKDLQQQLSEMHDELDQAKKAEMINTEKEEIAQLSLDFQEMLLRKEEQEEVLHHRERELSALKGALKEEVETHDKYIEALKEEYQQELEKLLRDLELSKEVTVYMRRCVSPTNHCSLGWRMIFCNNLKLLLVFSKLTKLNHEHRELKEKLKEERKQIEELWRAKTELEDERRLQDRAVEQLQRKMNNIMEECEASTDVLQNQVDEAREKSQRELAELRRQLQEKGAELEKSRQAAKKLQEELLPLEQDLQRCHREQQEAQLRGRQLEQRVEELEERNAATVEDRERQVKLMEVNVTAAPTQEMDQIRNELIQERAVRQDLECDKTSLERQNKDLKSRVTHLEGSQRTNQDSLVFKLNGRIQELEERLQGEERDNNSLQQANRKLERKVKEMKMQADEEHINLQSERDQLTQRLKTAKRQMDEAEEEIERLEHTKKRLQRELDEQIEANEQLHGQLSTLRNEMRRKKKSPSLIKVVEDDGNDMDGSGSD
uniref:Cingulin-like protein 1 n=1 Tax=Echeneis naucrates TaxID=173247 RepID=A0A665W357_ECHNA